MAFASPVNLSSRAVFSAIGVSNTCSIHGEQVQQLSVSTSRGKGSATMIGGFGRIARPIGVPESTVPSGDTECACGSGRSYGRCCRPIHVMSRTPRMAEELLRARYTAYAYRLPTFIMRTTAKSAREFDRRKWRAEIDDFCRQYRFDGGVDILEESMTGPDGCSIVFRANMLERGAPTAFVELSKFRRDEGVWYYVDGKLVDFYDDAED